MLEAEDYWTEGRLIKYKILNPFSLIIQAKPLFLSFAVINGEKNYNAGNEFHNGGITGGRRIPE